MKDKGRTTAELLQIAEDIYKGQVFTDRHIRPNDKNLASSIFMVLALADEKTMDGIKKFNPGTIYEYLSKAMPTAINGYPIFGSMQMLSMEDSKTVWATVAKMEEAMKIAKEAASQT